MFRIGTLGSQSDFLIRRTLRAPETNTLKNPETYCPFFSLSPRGLEGRSIQMVEKLAVAYRPVDSAMADHMQAQAQDIYTTLKAGKQP